MNNKIHSGLFKKLQNKLIQYVRIFDTNTIVNFFKNDDCSKGIQRIYIINLDRKPDRWLQVSRELKRIKCHSGKSLLDISRRFSAVDARYFDGKIDNSILQPYFSLADQLQVEPNPILNDEAYCNYRRIEMTSQEIAIALSHIYVWKSVSVSNVPYTLILEDDIYFQYGFAQKFDEAWQYLINRSSKSSAFDLLFLSFQEVGTNSKIKRPQLELVRKPDRGIWQASGYVLSREGAQMLLKMLPVYGPVDLWLNLQFDKLDVFLTKHPIIEQRVDVPSTNSYSIMPILSQIGVYIHEKPLIIKKNKLPGPIFAFGNVGSGLTALAMALSTLGYTCCSDITALPDQEQYNLITKGSALHFNAYVNIGSLYSWPIGDIKKIYTNARFIYTTLDEVQNSLINDKHVLYLPIDCQDKWEALSNFLGCEYPAFQYPVCHDIGQKSTDSYKGQYSTPYNKLKFDISPWIISSKNWRGITIGDTNISCSLKKNISLTWGSKNNLDDPRWRLRDDTFPGNLAIFKPENIKVNKGITQLVLVEQATAVRSFTSAAIVTQQKLLFGKFIVKLKPSNVSGIVTGMFLHRNSPHQEIDIEFLGKDTAKMLINVFYNPGLEGTKLEYGYRGTPVLINLGFDAAKEFHKYEIEWQKNYLRWYVDGYIVYERVQWDPTPIPNLPMEFNLNIWCSNSKELAGKLDKTKMPTITEVQSIQIDNY